MRGAFAVALTALLGHGCAGCPADTPGSSGGPSPRSSTTALAESSTAPAVVEVEAAPPPSACGEDRDAAGCPSYARGFARARRFGAAGDWRCAIRAWDEALRDRPLDPTARAERGYARMRAGDDPTTDFDLALGVARDPTLRAQIWFNVGLYSEKADPDHARMAFVVAERLGSRAATARLGKASRCTATWEVRPTLDFPILEPKPAAALLSRCVDGGACVVSTGSQSFHLFNQYIEPLDGGRCYQENLIDTDKPSAHGFDGGVLWVDTTGGSEDRSIDGEFDGAAGVTMIGADGWWTDRPPADPDAAGACRPDLDAGVVLGFIVCAQCFQPAVSVPRPRQRTYFDVRSRRPLLALHITDGDVTASFDAGVATVTGGGCDARVPLGR